MSNLSLVDSIEIVKSSYGRIKTMNFKKSALLCLSAILIAPQAFAYLSISESAEVMSPGLYQFGVEPQILTNKGGGTNLNAFFDAGINESTSARMLIGVGAVDFNAAASVKYVPFPDVDQQPAIGIRAGAGFARDEGINLLNFQAGPIVSKKLEVDNFGNLTPYVGIPMTFTIAKDRNYNSANFVFGAEAKSSEMPELTFGGELGFELKESYSYISLFLTYPFEAKSR